MYVIVGDDAFHRPAYMLFCGFVSFEHRDYNASLSLTREMARRNAVSERERKKQLICCQNSYHIFLYLNYVRDDAGLVPYDKKYIRHICFLKTKKLKQASI